MGLIMVGIDEAGYGPRLGPMCAGMSIWRIESWRHAGASPDLWKYLGPSVCRKPAPGLRGRAASAPIAIADSKAIKRPNDSAAAHPLCHIERGVLAALSCEEGGPGDPPADDLALASHLCGRPGGRWHDDREHWYETDPTPLPVSCSPDSMRIAANLLRAGLRSAGVSLVASRCRVVGEIEFNETIRRTNNKARVVITAVGELVRAALGFANPFPGDEVHIVCDRLGGRERYTDLLREWFPGSSIGDAAESSHRSRYWIELNGRRVGVAFEVEADAAHLPVAMASMVAKYMRELAMARFNRYWGARSADLLGVAIKPTAGYGLDAGRWLAEAGEIIDPAERQRLVRLA